MAYDRKRMARDAARIARPAFRAAGWTYRDDDLPPTAGRLIAVVEDVLAAVERMAEENPGQDCTASRGRFTAYYSIDGGQRLIGVDLALGSFYDDATPEEIEKATREEQVA